MLAPHGLTPLLSNFFNLLKLLMSGNTLIMLIIRTLELTTLSKSGKLLTGKMLKRDLHQLPQRNDYLIEYFHLSLDFYFPIFL
jgi:hypothetical protein